MQDPIDPWRIDLIVASGAGFTAGERRAISRDVARGLLEPLGPGRYARTGDLAGLTAEQRHILELRALSAASREPLVVSHWSAAVAHGLPVLRHRLARPHVTLRQDKDRHRPGVCEHLFGFTDVDVVRVHDLLVTGVGRTVIDIAGATPLEEGVIAADHLLAAGLPRGVLLDAEQRAGPRRATRRIEEVVAFAHPGAESAAESRTRVTAYRIGTEVPELQHRFALDDGRSAFVDTWFPRARAALEVDGDATYTDPRFASSGAAAAVLVEKRREDQIRPRTNGFARIGWAQSGSVVLLRPVLARIGVEPLHPRPVFSAWADAAAAAEPRRRTLLLG